MAVNLGYLVAFDDKMKTQKATDAMLCRTPTCKVVTFVATNPAVDRGEAQCPICGIFGRIMK